MSNTKIKTYPSQARELFAALHYAGITEIGMIDSTKLSTLAEKNEVNIHDVLFSSLAMKNMRKRYGYFPIKEDDTLGEIIEKMHSIMPF